MTTLIYPGFLLPYSLDIMEGFTRQTTSTVLGCLILCLSIQVLAHNDSNKTAWDSTSLQLIRTLRYTNPDSSLKLLDRSFEFLIRKGDTLGAVKTLFEFANINGNLANYKDAYDKLWLGLSLADEAGLEKEIALLYIEIGRYYSFYKKRAKALEYFQISLDINKRLLSEGKIAEADLVDNYYAFCSTYRELDNPALAREYLDSCFLYFEEGESPIERSFLQFELASIQSANGNYQAAVKTFEEVQSWFEEFDPSYLVLFYTYKGDALMGLNRFEESESYYKQALEISDQYHMHIDFSPLIHEKLSDLYLQQGDYQRAYQRLKRVKELDATFF